MRCTAECRLFVPLQAHTLLKTGRAALLKNKENKEEVTAPSAQLKQSGQLELVHAAGKGQAATAQVGSIPLAACTHCCVSLHGGPIQPAGGHISPCNAGGCTGMRRTPEGLARITHYLKDCHKKDETQNVVDRVQINCSFLTSCSGLMAWLGQGGTCAQVPLLHVSEQAEYLTVTEPYAP